MSGTSRLPHAGGNRTSDVVRNCIRKRRFGGAGDNSLPMQWMFDADEPYDGMLFALLSSQGDSARHHNY